MSLATTAPERCRQGLRTQLCRPATQGWPLPGLNETPCHRIRPFLPVVLAGPSIPQRAKCPCGSNWGLVAMWLGHLWWQQCLGHLPSPLPPCLSELEVQGWHVQAASLGQGETGGWGCACSLPEAAYHAVLTHTEAETCVPCTDRWED